MRDQFNIFRFRILLVLVLFIISFQKSEAQNTYAEVTGIAGTVVTLRPNHSGTFVVGDLAMVMQMKGVSVVEANNAAYGSVISFNEAGSWTIATVLAVTATTVTLDINVDKYDVNSNVQLISIPPDDGAGNYVEDGTNEPPPWDGYTGGVYVASVCGTYTLNGDLLNSSVGGKGGGFRGGFTNAADKVYYEPLIEQWVAFDTLDFLFSAFKGEGIASTYCKSGDFMDPDLFCTQLMIDRGWCTILGAQLGDGYRKDPSLAYSSGGWAYWFTLLADPDPKKTIQGPLCSIHDVGSGALANAGGSGTQIDGGGGGGGNGGAGGAGGCGWYINYDCRDNGKGLCGNACNATGSMDSTDVQGKGGYATNSTAGEFLFLGGGWWSRIYRLT